MPLFQYRCPRCEREIEHLEWNASPPYTRECPDCKLTMERLPSAASFAVKGYAARNGYSTKESR